MIEISDLCASEIEEIWGMVEKSTAPIAGIVAWSFEGNGIRTRTSFIQAFRAVGLTHIELPNLLKGPERCEDLAGYLDPFYKLYVVRESTHERLSEFANASKTILRISQKTI